MKSDPQNFHRRSIRLKDYDYTQRGGYYVTIMTFQRQCLFGEIANREMKLNDYGCVADECWHAIPEHFSNVELGAFVVMPNHIHGIIVINDENHRADVITSARKGTIYRAPTPTYHAPTEKYGKPVIGSIPTIIRASKAAVTRRLRREFNVMNIWQRNYYEHVILDNEDWNRIHQYIESNPFAWENDDENPIMRRP